MRFPRAAKGVTKIFVAEVMSLISVLVWGVILAVTSASGGVENLDLSGELSSASLAIVIACLTIGLLMLLATLLRVIGYIQAAGDEEYFTRAIIYAIISFVLSLVTAFLQDKDGTVMAWIYTIVLAVAQLMQLLVLTSTINGLRELSYRCRRGDMESRGGTIMKIIGTIYTLNIALIILNRFFKLFLSEDIVTTITTIVAIIIVILTVIGYILYFGYLGKASRMLRES